MSETILKAVRGELSRHRKLTIVAVTVVAACAATFVAFSLIHDDSDAAERRPERPAITAKEAASLDNVLAGADSKQIAARTSKVVRADFLASPSRLWPAGTKLTIDAATFKRLGPDVGTVTARSTGASSGAWTMLLSWEDGQWTVSATSRTGS